MLFECITTINDERKSLLVSANSYAEAEANFDKYAKTIPGEQPTLTAIYRTEHQLISDASEQRPHRGKIGYNTSLEVLYRQCPDTHNQPQDTANPRIIYF